MTTNDTRDCPCGSGQTLAQCCDLYHAGARAGDAETLMRSRYSAYALGDDAYLARTWHPSTRPAAIESAAGPQWRRLEIMKAASTGPATAEVEFIAHYDAPGGSGQLHETSRFVREHGQWLYLGGTIHPSAREKIGRNAPCPCGSGRKYKRCCG